MPIRNFHIVFMLLLAFLCLDVAAEVNLLHNGDFKEGLLYWKFESDAGAAPIPYAEGGPENSPFIRLKSLGGGPVSFSQLHCTFPKAKHSK